MRVFTTLPQEDLRKVGPAAQAIEAAGYTGVSTQENRHDPFLSLAVAGAATRRIELHTSVAIAFARSPMVAANIGWDLAASTGARFTLGLGSQVRAHNERRFSVPWSAPAPRMREYIQAVRAIWSAWKEGGKLDYEGKHYRFTLMTPNFVPEPYDGPPPRRRRPGHAEGGGRGGRRRQAPRVLHAQVSRGEHPADHRRGPGQTRTRARELRDLGRRFRGHRQGRRGGRQTVRLGALSCGVLWLDARLLAGVRDPRAGRPRPQAQRHDARRPME